jgi:hypothetical protein
VGVHDHAQVLGHRDPGDGDRILEGHEEAGVRPVLGSRLGDVLALEGDRALGDLEAGMAHDRVRERRLTGAVRAHQRVDLALLHIEVDPLEDLLVLGADVQVSNL